MLKRVALKNFKRFREVELPMGALTVLMGVNGSGKSTFIQSLLVARQSFETASLKNGYLLLSGELAQLGTGIDALFEGAGKEEPISLTFTGDGSRRTITSHYQATSDRLPLVDRTDLEGFEALGAATFVYLSAERLGPRLLSPLAEAKAADGQLGPKGDGTLAVLQYHRRVLLAEGDPRLVQGATRSIEEQTQAYLAAISPGARLTLTPHSELDSVRASVSYVGEGGVQTREFRTTNVGFGISYSLPIIVGCLTAKPGAMLIVENPEAHLHTMGQRKMAELLWRTSLAGVQVVIETHSRELFYQFRKLGRSHPDNEAVLHYFSNGLTGDVTKLSVNSLEPIQSSLADWPAEFFDAFGSPGDLVAPV